MIKKIVLGFIALTSLSASAEVIWQRDAFIHCAGDWKYAGCTAANLEIELGVWPVAWGHDVYVVYSQDHWQTVSYEVGNWFMNVNNPFGSQDEVWTISIPVGYTSMGGQLASTEYALAVENAWGDTFWDNNGGNNYFVAGGGHEVIDVP